MCWGAVWCRVCRPINVESSIGWIVDACAHLATDVYHEELDRPALIIVKFHLVKLIA